YVMHGFLWSLHKDHHVVDKSRWWQFNDFFAIFFAVPSFLSILFSKLNQWPLLGAIGFGVMAYGIAYFFVHEVVIHKRINFKGLNKGRYIKGLKAAHHVHHSNKMKDGGVNFGMLVVPYKYFKPILKKT
ncbi:MAG: sterol desaturase family protein, partial [Bdellovibrionales bacterium]|nr:sterol desaturase family protein [Bdellovibrionales bacterium]